MPGVSHPAVETPVEIGPYKITQTLGEGGMGVVYEAEQSEPVRRRVAVKLLKLGMDTKQVVARFEAERQALAVMDHPFIAKVFDAGATSDGRPFFVMELVRGVPLVEYCDRENLSTRRRLELFVSLCQAIQHAHQKGVIHRDLKPSNVLVSEDGDTAIPKVIDFGIAKAVGQQLTDQTLVTRHGEPIGTPAYMSPEQAGITTLDVDTRADVCSLGVLLYELLVARLPIDPADVGYSVFASKLARLETDPPTPSSRLDSLGDQRSDVARSRTTDPATLKRELKGDLDWIVMKAIEKERARRYATAAALADDIQRHLDEQPIQARPPSTIYRLGKFVRRNRFGVAAASVALVAVLAGGVGVTVGLVRATRAEKEARREAEVARQVSDFLVGLFEVSDPSETRGDTVTAREILDRGADRVGSELTDQPVVQARMLDTLGRVHHSLGHYRRARELAERALALEEREFGADDLRVAATLSTLGRSYRRLGEFDKSREALQRALRIREASLGPDDLLVAEAHTNLGFLYWQLDDDDRATSHHNRALAIREQRLGPDHADVARSLRNLAIVRTSNEEHEPALDAYLRAQAILEAQLGSDHPEVADNLDSLGLAYAALDKTSEARSHADRAFEIRRAVLGDNHPVLAYSYLNLGKLDVQEGKLDDAVPLYEEGLRIREATLGSEHPRTADLIESLAILHARRGELAKAQPLFERSLRTYQKAYGLSNSETLESHRNLAILYTMRGRHRDAIHHLRRAFEGGYAEFMSLDQSLFDPLRKYSEFRDLEANVKRNLVAQRATP